jgi:hypothetical protein
MPMTRKVLCLMVACLLLPVWPVLADKPRDGMSYRFNFYGDNGKNLVIAPSVTLSKRLTDTYYLGASVGVDAITSATMNAQPAPAPSPGEDDEGEGGNFSFRVPVSLSLTYDQDNDTLTAGGYYSYEDTYVGRSLFASYTRRMNLNNTALGVAYSHSFDNWVPDRVLPTDRRSERSLDLTVTQLLSPRRSVQFTWSVLRSTGFLAQPTDSFVTAASATIYSNYPEERRGSAAAIRFITLLDDPTSLHLQYRYYRDDWHIRSDTAGIELFRDLSTTVTLSGRYRYYRQSASYFAKDLDLYTPGDPLISIDYRMYAFQSHTVGASAILRPSQGFLSSADPDKVKIKLSADVYTTSKHENIQYRYHTDRLTGFFTTIAVDYDF